MSNLYAIGDIHGQRGMLEILFEKVPFQKDDEIVFIGDYIDRGPDSKGVVEDVLQFKKTHPNSTFLRGNHEDLFLDYLNGDNNYQPGVFLMNGGFETLQSYGVDTRDDPPRLPPIHMKFFKELEIFHETKGFVFVHAGMRPGVPLKEQSERDMIWIRHEFFESDADFGKPIVFGHTPMPDVLDLLPRMLGIDTGAAYGGKLTCVQLEANQIVETFQVNSTEVMA
jgi:serine/threonine protein phosphatase 1